MNKVFAFHIPLAILNGDNSSKQRNLHVDMHVLRYMVIANTYAMTYTAITDTCQSAISIVQGGNSSALEYPGSF